MAKRKIFDAHHHLWSLKSCRYPWLEARGVRRFFGDPTPIQKDYLVADLLEDSADFDLVGSAHIQVGAAEDEAIKETQWLQSVADSAPRLPSAIVAFVDLRRGDLHSLLDAHKHARSFRGVRQIIGRHPDEDRHTSTGALLDDVRFLRGLKLLERSGLTFDLQLTEMNYWAALRLFRHLPDLKTAICHFGSPWDISKDGFKRWAENMQSFAELPNMHLKCSGFGMFLHQWDIADIRPYIETAINLFGPERCMAGSNFPVDKLYAGYGRIWNAIDAIVTDPHIRDQIAISTGAEFYSADLAVKRSKSDFSARAPSRINA